MLKVAILDDYQNVAQQFVDLKKLSGKYEFKIFSEPFLNEADAIEKLAEFEALLIMRERTPITKNLIDNLNELKFVITSGLRNKSIDLEATKKRKILVCGTDINLNPTPELTWALILGLARNFTDKLSLGMQLKYVEENIDNYSYSNVLFDFGSNYETGFRDLNIAFVFQHIGPDVTPIDTKFRSPLMFRIGMSDYVYRIESIKSMMIIELVHPTDSEDYLILAQDLELLEKINLRMGSKIKKSIFGHSFGFGIKDVNISGNNTISIDYSILMSNYVFKDFHSLSISLNR